MRSAFRGCRRLGICAGFGEELLDGFHLKEQAVGGFGESDEAEAAVEAGGVFVFGIHYNGNRSDFLAHGERDFERVD